MPTFINPGTQILEDATGVTGTSNGTDYSLVADITRNTGVLQVDITSGTGNVQLQGRLSQSMEWTDLLDSAITTSTIIALVLPKYVRVQVTNGSALAYKAALRY